MAFKAQEHFTSHLWLTIVMIRIRIALTDIGFTALLVYFPLLNPVQGESCTCWSPHCTDWRVEPKISAFIGTRFIVSRSVPFENNFGNIHISNDGSGEEPDKAESEESVCAVAILDASLGNIWFVESDHWPIKYSQFKSPTNSIKAISTWASAFAFPVFHFWECERGLSTSPGFVSFSALITS